MDVLAINEMAINVLAIDGLLNVLTTGQYIK